MNGVARPAGLAEVRLDLGQAARWRTLALPSLLERGALQGGRPAVVFEGRTRTYGEARERMRRLAHGLIGLGIEPMARVAFLSTNRLEYLEIEAGIAAACAIMVPLNWRLRPGEVATVLRRCGAVAAIVEDKLLAPILDLRRRSELPELRTVIALDGDGGDLAFADLLAGAATGPAPREPRFEDPHEIIFTSGTTGRPKGVVWTNGGLLFNSMQQVIDFRIGPESSTYAAIDLHYIGGRHDLTWPVIHAGGVVHVKGSGGFDAEALLRYVCEHGITHVFWPPTMLFELLRLERPERFDTRRLRFIMSGGAPVSAAVTAAVQERFPDTAFVQVYGLTEGGGSVTFVPDEALRRKPGSAGLPSTHAAIRIVGPDGCDRAPNADGEIWVRAPSMTAGYWDEPELTAEALADDWLRTGDIGQLDEDGFLYVTGRKKDMIISGGMNIFPAEIEDVLRLHPSVADVAVIGLPHEKWGEQVCAVIEARPGREVVEAEIVAYCADRLAGYKKPSTVRLVEALPRTASGKPQKFVLRERFGTPDAASQASSR